MASPIMETDMTRYCKRKFAVATDVEETERFYGRKLKVLFIMQNLEGGGAERVALTLLRHLNRQRFDPVLFLVEQRGAYFREVPGDIRVLYGSESLKYNKYLIPYYLGKLLTEACTSAAIIGVLETRATYLAFMAGLLARKPVIGWVHVALDRFLKELPHWNSSAAKFVYPRLKYIVCVSNAVAASMGNVASVKEERVKVIYNPYEIYSIVKAAGEQHPQWYVDILKRPTIIAVSRMVNYKGLDILIKAHAKSLHRGVAHNLVIVGSGQLRRELGDLANRLNVASSVFMPGYIVNPYNLVKQATALVCPSRYEGFSNVIVEALALGTPVVSSACGGPTELLDDGRYGILVAPEDVDALADGIAKILTDASLREKLSKSGTERARWFSPGNIVAQWEELLVEVSR